MQDKIQTYPWVRYKILCLIVIVLLFACKPVAKSPPIATTYNAKTVVPSIKQTNTPLPIPTGTFTPLPTRTPAARATVIQFLNPILLQIQTPILTPTSPFLHEVACIPKNTTPQVARVTYVLDGDTIGVILTDGKEYRVRYIGMDTPDEGDPCFTEAIDKNAQLVAGKQVILVKDVSDKDQYGRLLRYVFVDSVFVNYELVQSGYAQVASYPPDVACNEQFLAAQKSASAIPMCFSAPTQLPAATATGESGNCDPAYPTVCIPPPPPDLDCKDISERRFKVLPPDPHRFDGDGDGIGCESG